MDFLEIRKKAQERAAARAAAGAAASRPAEAPPARGAGSPPLVPADLPPASADPVVTAVDVLEGELAARLQGLPAAAAAPVRARPDDPRFTTWRPGAAAPPPLPPAPEPSPAAEPDPADFTVVAPGRPPRRRASDRAAVASRPAGDRAGARGRDAAPGARAEETERPGTAAAGPAGDAGGLARALDARPAGPATAAATLDEFFYRPDEEAPVVALPGDAGAEASAAPAPAALDEFLTFRLGHEEYGVPIELVREVLKAPPITEVPRAPAHVVGVVTVRGEVVAVFDPRRRLGLAPAALLEGEGRIVLVDAGEGTYGLLVDAVAKVVRLPRGSVEACPQGIGGASAECLAGIGREDGRLFTVLDLVALLRRAPAARRGAEGRAHADA